MKQLVCLICLLASMASAQQRKSIMDPAEYNAYVSAVNACATKPPLSSSSAQAFESFLQHYPNSVMQEESLEILLMTYECYGESRRLVPTAERLLKINRNNVAALAVMACDNKSDQSKRDEFATRGLDAIKTPPSLPSLSESELKTYMSEATELFRNPSAPSAKDRLHQVLSLAEKLYCSPKVRF